MRLAFQHGHSYIPPRLNGIGMSGLGLDSETNQIASTAINAAATTGTILTGLAHAGMISAAFGPAAPIAMAIAGLATIGMAIANQFHGCGQTCIQATQIANQVESYLQDNLRTYMGASPHYVSLRAGALNNVDLAIDAMRQACGDPALGDAGRRCISERLVPGAPAPWCPNPGNTGCDWYALYRDPIANDPNVVPDPVAPGISSILSSATGTFPVPLLLGGAAVLLIALSTGGGK